MNAGPFFRRSLFEPLWVGRSRSPLLTYWKELEKSQFLPKSELEERQFARLGKLLSYVNEKNLFYQKRFNEAGVRPSDIQCPKDMMRLPVLTKEEIRSNYTTLLSTDFSKERLLHFKTGGSTGKPLEIFLTEECSELRNACTRRHDRWSGWEVGEPIGAVWGNPVLPSDIRSYLKNLLISPTIYLDTMHLDMHSVTAFAREWEELHPTLLFGHSHSIYQMAMYVRELGITSINPKAIITSSMMLIPHERTVIEEVFHTKVFDRYGCEEVSLIASECEKHEGLHMNIEHLYIEFLKDDGTQAEPGEPGNIIVTDLMNWAMPFVRYKIEDIGVYTKRDCSCGRGLPLMENVTGRTADFLVRHDMTKIAGVSLIENTLTKIPGIDQMQIVQETLDRIVLNIVPGVMFTEDNENSIVQYFHAQFGERTTIILSKVATINPENNGKYRFCISNINTFCN